MADRPDPGDPMGRTTAEFDAERTACVADGGDFRPAGISILTCIRPTSDGGASCTRATACEGVCLADPDTGQGSCAPARPIFGCFTMYDETGEAVDLCVD